VFFNISGLDPGTHRLEVVNGGNDGTAALGLTHIYTRNSTRVSTPPVSEPPAPTVTTAKGSKGIIVGAVVGSVAALALIILLAYGIIIFRRRRGQTGVVLGGRLSGQPTTGPVPDVGLDGPKKHGTWNHNDNILPPGRH
jgi:hypothetical protein